MNGIPGEGLRAVTFARSVMLPAPVNHFIVILTKRVLTKRVNDARDLWAQARVSAHVGAGDDKAVARTVVQGLWGALATYCALLLAGPYTTPPSQLTGSRC